MFQITNRDLHKNTSPHITNSSLAQIRQWSTYFVEPDPKAGRHSGVPRVFNLDEAFKICVGGCLINSLSYKIIEAQQILLEVFSWLEKKDWTPMQKVDIWKPTGKMTKTPPRWHFRNDFPDLTLFVSGKGDKFGYIIREVLPIDDESIENLEFVKAENWAENWHEGNKNPFLIQGWDYSFGDQGESFKHVPRQVHLWDIINRLGNGWCQQANEVSL